MKVIISDSCSGCGACISACLFAALTLTADQPCGRGKKKATLDPDLCCACGNCIDQCPLGALRLGLDSRPDPEKS